MDEENKQLVVKGFRNPLMELGSSRAKEKNNTMESELACYGHTTVGEGGQIVIPKDVREKLDIKPGTKMQCQAIDQERVLLFFIQEVDES